MYTAVPFTGKTKTEIQFPPTVLLFYYYYYYFFFFKNCLLHKTFGEQLKVAKKEYFKNASLVLILFSIGA